MLLKKIATLRYYLIPAGSQVHRQFAHERTKVRQEGKQALQIEEIVSRFTYVDYAICFCRLYFNARSDGGSCLIYLHEHPVRSLQLCHKLVGLMLY